MYLFCNSRIHVITLYSVHVCVYYASILRCWHLVWILIRTDHPCLGVGCHTMTLSSLHVEVLIGKQGRRALNQPWTPLLSMGVSARTRPRRWLGHGTLNPPLCARLCFLPPLARGGGELSNVPAMYAMDSSLGAPRAPRPLPQGCTARPWGSVVAQHVGGVVVAMRQLLVLHDRLVIHAAEVVHGGLRPDDGGEGLQDLEVELRRDGRGTGGGKHAKSGRHPGPGCHGPSHCR
jgi:hypothetical protein